MNGAESLVRTLVGGGVNVCFTNPGTSEMHFVAALDKVEGMRCVLALFEGVVTGAADGYWRMRESAGSDAPALRARAGKRAGQFTQRQEGELRDRQYRRGARLLSYQVRRAPHRRYRRHRAARIALGQDLCRGENGGGRWGRGHRHGLDAAWAHRHPDPARRYGLE